MLQSCDIKHEQINYSKIKLSILDGLTCRNDFYLLPPRAACHRCID